MKIFVFSLFFQSLFLVRSEEFDRRSLCESCIAVSKEIENALQDAPISSRPATIKKLLRGTVCDKLPQDKRPSCVHLLGIHRHDFSEALSSKGLKKLDVLLCYERSMTCVGVKFQAFKDRTTASFESDIEALLSEHKDNVRLTKPLQTSSTVQPKKEL